MKKHPLHLKYSDLQKSPLVKQAVEHKEQKTREKVPNDPAERIEAHMDRLENIFLNPDERKRERNLEMFRDKIYDELIIKQENFPQSYFDLQGEVARERGQLPELKRTGVIIEEYVVEQDNRASIGRDPAASGIRAASSCSVSAPQLRSGQASLNLKSFVSL